MKSVCQQLRADEAAMYHGGDARTAERLHETPPGPTAEERTRLALQRVRRLLNDFSPGVFADIAWLRAALDQPLADPAAEIERGFVLGWLAWWSSDFAGAEPLLSEAARCGRDAGNLPAAAEAAYWGARVRLRLGRKDACADYEAILRVLGGSPQATCWFVDLLWRSGRSDRAEQVWKSVRANRRVTACPETPLQEVRSLLRRGDITAAERLLEEASPKAGVVWVERLLLLVWIAVTREQQERARAILDQARQGPYPVSALDAWVRLCEQRSLGAAGEPAGIPQSPLLADYCRGQQARQSGDRAAAAAAYREALTASAVQPFARYGLACLGEEAFAPVLGTQPGLFLAVRCRARIAVERFRRRELSPAEFLEAVKPATAAGYRDASVEHFRRIAQMLEERTVDLAVMRQIAEEQGPEAENARRSTLEQVVGRVPPEEILAVLMEWSRIGKLIDSSAWQHALGRQLLRLALLARAARRPVSSAVVATIRRLLPHDDRTSLVEGTADHARGDASSPLALHDAARELAAGGVDDEWRQRVARLRAEPRLRGLIQALLLQEAAQRGDTSTVAALLDETDPWRCFRAAPPRFVLRAVVAIAASLRTRPAWQDILARWLRVWGIDALGAEGAVLAAEGGLTATTAPPGVAPAAWFLHQAARAVIRQDFRAPLAATRCAVEADPDLARTENDTPASRTIRDALPEFERRALAECLIASLLPHESPQIPPPALLVDAIDLLHTFSEGETLLSALRREDAEAVRATVATLREAPALPPRLAHHLALLQRRAALALESSERLDEALPHVRRAWLCWLRLLAAPHDGLAADAGAQLLDHLLAEDRRRIVHLLARDQIDEARRHAAFLQELPAAIPAEAAALREDVARRTAGFRDDLATDYLLSTREAMQHGHILEGLRCDYTRGLMLLRRLLSIDRDNLRLLTALVEVSTEWFLDLHHLGDAAGLREQVDRYTPFALQLARLVADRPGDLAARAAVAEYWKFRGFISRDPDERVALYREALRFNPANSNVRDLLAQLGPVGAVEE
jgi:hypothetical protein